MKLWKNLPLMHCSWVCSWPYAFIFFHSISSNKPHCFCPAGDNDAQMLCVLSGLVCWTGGKWSLSLLIPNSHWMGFISPALLVQKEIRIRIRIRICSSAPSWDTDTAERGLICPSTGWTGTMDNSFEQDTNVLEVMHLRRLGWVFFFPRGMQAV